MKKLTKESFIKRANQIHNNKYDYSLVDYINTSTKVIFVCPEHGEFLATPNNHLYRKAGCPDCGIKNRADKNRNDFETRAREVHGNKYDYSKVNYKRLDEHVTITCPEHGDFEQLPAVHFRGNGCKLCSNKKWDTNKFVFEARKIWGDKYDYSQTIYSGYYGELKITCPVHGLFYTKPLAHLKSSYAGCKSCYIDSMRLTTEEFIDRAKKVHGDTYNYDKTNYVKATEKVIITCDKHGDFEQNPMNHTELSQGCPSCAVEVSKPHQEVIDFLNELGIKNIRVNDRSFLPSGRELDIYLPDFNIGIEVDGVWFHSAKFKSDKKYHQEKHKECESIGIKLFQFWDLDIRDKFPIVKSMIQNALQINVTKIPARKTIVEDIDPTTYMSFLNETHLQGGIGSSVKRGIFYDGVLLAVMGMSKKNDAYVIDRFASKSGFVVIGGFSKLLKSFGVQGKIISHSANRYSLGDVYKKNGFVLEYEHPFTLYYTDAGKNLYSRNKYQKHKLKSMIGYSEKKTADEILAENDIYPVYGSGTKTWVLN